MNTIFFYFIFFFILDTLMVFSVSTECGIGDEPFVKLDNHTDDIDTS